MIKKFRWITSLATAAIAISLMSPVSSSASTCAGLDYQGCDLRNAKFVGRGGTTSLRMDLKNANFSGANLSGAEFTNVTLDSANFSNANLTGAIFKAAFATTINFNKADLSNSSLTSVSLINADFTDAKLAGVQTYGSANFSTRLDQRTKLPADWQEWLGFLIGPGAKLRFFNSKSAPLVLPANATGGIRHLEGLDCYQCSFAGLDLKRANFSKAVFTGRTSFDGANLAGANFTSVTLRSIPNQSQELGSLGFKGSTLSGAIFTFADIPNTNFENATLAGASFNHTKLSDPNFKNVNLTGINLSKAIMTGVSFSGKDLTKINLSGALLTGVDMTDANLTGANLEGLLATEIYGKPTGLPKGWKLVGTRLAATFIKAGIPSVTGTYSKGSTLSANPGTWDVGTKFQYQWKRNGFAIPKATSQKYKLTANDSGQNISVSVTGVKPDRFDLTKTSSPKKSK